MRPPNARQYCPTRANTAQREPIINIMPNVRPNTSWWNIGRVGFPRVGARTGHVDFILFVSILLALGSQRENNFQWNMDYYW